MLFPGPHRGIKRVRQLVEGRDGRYAIDRLVQRCLPICLPCGRIQIVLPGTELEPLMPPEVVLNELDEFSARWELLHGQAQNGARCRRNRHRRKFRTACEIWYFQERGQQLKQQSAMTRNLSENGIALLAKGMIHGGTPIEVMIEPSGRRAIYLGGLVRFCRYTGNGLHEIGAELRAHQNRPIFSECPERAVVYIDWIQSALRRPASLPARALSGS
jgi:hypothetical protein